MQITYVYHRTNSRVACRLFTAMKSKVSRDKPVARLIWDDFGDGHLHPISPTILDMRPSLKLLQRGGFLKRSIDEIRTKTHESKSPAD